MRPNLSLIGYKDASFSFHFPIDAFIKEGFAHMGVDSRKRIIEKVNISVKVKGSCQRNSLLLTTGQVNTLINIIMGIRIELIRSWRGSGLNITLQSCANLVSDQGLVPSIKNAKVRLQTAHLKNFLITLRIKGLSEEDVLLNRCIQNPCLNEEKRDEQKSG